ncbi:hypothetical protein [Pseudoalteromonas sp. PPB1]|uniref:hypothetical protein n=1 Tax=Pseudoalteromonas sp. PPB1 TaxID=2756136 RepID=UPI0018919696|nr:hypothetical protein [Pseudoalteromonas sp. PPB1]
MSEQQSLEVESTSQLNIELSLLEWFGLLIPDSELWRILKHENVEAFHTARRQGCLPVGVFRIRGQREYFAFSSDVAKWLASEIGGRTTEK